MLSMTFLSFLILHTTTIYMLHDSHTESVITAENVIVTMEVTPNTSEFVYVDRTWIGQFHGRNHVRILLILLVIALISTRFHRGEKKRLF